MAIKLRQYPHGGLEVDITVLMPDGTKLRERRKAPSESRTVVVAWARARERELLLRGRPKKVEAPPPAVPTLAEFWPRFVEGYCLANKQKASGIESKQFAFRCYLAPLLGTTRLDAIDGEKIAALKGALRMRAPSTTNNVLSTLRKALQVAAEWGVIRAMPSTIRLVKVQQATMVSYQDVDYERLVTAALASGARTAAAVLLAGEAGLRRGEILALEWSDVDLMRGLLSVQRSTWRGQVQSTKGWEARHVPLTKRLALALAAVPRDAARVVSKDGAPATEKMLQNWVRDAQARAGLRATGALHILRHTFCSRLASSGAPPIAIQRLAGHKHVTTTMRYMHLAHGEANRAIALLDARGGILETTPEFPAPRRTN